MKTLDEKTRKLILSFQRNEITEHIIYKILSERTKDRNNSEVLKNISAEELEHYNFWRKYTGEDVGPDRKKIWFYIFVSRVFGLTFGIKLMEKGETSAETAYGEIAREIPEARDIADQEDAHERELMSMIDEERLRYVGSVVLGLNDALVELTGALSGFTLALQDTKLIAVVGLVTGISASLSMAASEYLATKTEEDEKHPLKASLYTGAAYIATVFILILPFFFFGNPFVSLAVTITSAVIIIMFFNYYISVAKDLPFRRRFLEMAAISLGVSAISFFIGHLVRIIFKL
ncbi:MAG: VIT1/CCC1 transporter family protein [Deltaproteobacteria bacterium]|uniref:VIT1/CCC1 transporter family protein n=1 Tax=Candidatus Zymogenus saltonus TaxID=2844893 RepID=A0A9D8PPA1_9DELT|nr:VIT1/CCC1 transporter family protein [Candidatus Zymogenus saltonus]